MNIITAALSEVRLECALGDEERTIVGLAAPWNVTANASTGPVKFLAGSLPVDGPAPKFLRDHDSTKPLGVVTERWSDDRGVWFKARISATAAGDEALILAADGVLDGVSVGAHPTAWTMEGNTIVVKSAEWQELSLLPFQAFKDARVTEVRAAEELEPDHTPDNTETTSEEDPMEETITLEAAATPTAPIIVKAEPARTLEDIILDVARGRGVRAANQDTGDSTGIIPEPIVGPLYNGLAVNRRLVSAIGVRAMPNSYGKTFTIPKVTQRPTVAKQNAEFDTLSSQAMIVDPITVNRSTYGGYVDLSELDIDITSPSALSLVIEEMAKAYAIETEEAACAALVAGATVTDTITSWTSASEVITAVFDAAVSIVSATGEMPTHIFAAPDRYADLATLQSTGGDFIFPSLNPSNAFGRLDAGTLNGSPAGLELVVSPQFAAGTFIVGRPDGMRLFEQQKGAISVDQPATLSVRVAWRGYFAAAFLDANKYVKFV